MTREPWYARPAPQFITAVLVAALVFVLVNPFMANERVFGSEPWHTFALLLPAIASLTFLHFAVPVRHRSSIVRHIFRVVVVSVVTYAVAAITLAIAVVVITGEFV